LIIGTDPLGDLTARMGAELEEIVAQERDHVKPVFFGGVRTSGLAAVHSRD
jgi:hypothetical protein